ncbi:fluoride efflux transporter CrcB [Aureimonas phyllosphaerae]|uniref:Fluoride-specific ion channel FluC n=1 Tax=Aureimonas phyllosphaerae TaxID=1166078 RepID=A0A7W6BXZ0_9HYPH|nr:fluoride efflux transporter CrcB [Aureimonas phyllosphaerae]MBB3934797.1 CrcB protein [Aureimonas phyllosphaerae]MBB3957988.1 CrcB protein [Aureimonas phyllosphaerae]SFF43483.1 camphor resistance protein CrcB [Aureimonas phyllosphaerae]
MLNVALVALGGALGSVARYGVSVAAGRWLGVAFPYGTLFVNVTGSFVMGVLVAWLSRHLEMPPELRVFLAVGVLGGYTTFSSFSLDAVSLWEGGSQAAALLYVGLSMVGGLLALAAGLALVRHLG